MVHIIINPSLSAAIVYNLFFNPPKFAEVSVILEPANSTRTDYSRSPIKGVAGQKMVSRYNRIVYNLRLGYIKVVQAMTR